MSLASTGLDPATRQRLERSLQAMETDRHGNLPLLIGISISLLLHGMLLVPRLQRLLSEGHDGVDRTRRADFSVEKEMEKRQARTDEERKAEEDEMLRLGIEDGTTQSTMTWIGYNEYQQHLARLSEVDQAAFRDTDEGGQPMPMARQAPPMVPQVPSPAEAAPPAPSAQAAVAADPSPPRPMQPPRPPSPSAPPPAPRPPDPARPAEPPPPAPDRKGEAQTTPPPPPMKTAATEATAPDAKAIQIPEAKTTQVEPTIQPVDKAPENPQDQPAPPQQQTPPELKAEPAPPAQATPPQTTPAPQPPAQPPSDPAQPQPPSPPQQPVPPTQAAPGKTQPSASPDTGPSPDPSARPGAKPGPKADGDLSDRESDATSTVNVPPSQWRTGKPLAAKGLKVLTKRPYFDELTSVTTAPRAPLVLIEFDREGKAVNCTLVESSGFPNVDQPILDSLYGWRAQGKQLEKLKPGETVKFRIRLLLK